jgi:hypothetical protein
LYEILPRPDLRRQWVVIEPLNVKPGFARIQAVDAICQQAFERVFRQRLIPTLSSSLASLSGRVIEMHVNALIHIPLQVKAISTFHTLFPLAIQHPMLLICRQIR